MKAEKQDVYDNWSALQIGFTLSEASSLCGIRLPEHEAECVTKSDLLGSQQNNQATVIDKEKKKQEKMSGSPEAKTDDRSRWLSLFLSWKVQQLPKLSFTFSVLHYSNSSFINHF